MSKNILMVVTNHTEMTKGKTTGIWLSEFAEAYIEFKKKGYTVTIASPHGGKSTVDPGSVDEHTPQEILDVGKYLQDTSRLEDASYDRFDAIFLLRRTWSDV